MVNDPYRRSHEEVLQMFQMFSLHFDCLVGECIVSQSPSEVPEVIHCFQLHSFGWNGRGKVDAAMSGNNFA